MCFDAKINFDDNAEFRQKEVFAMEETSEQDPREVEASKHDLNYIGMDGNIGCLGEKNICGNTVKNVVFFFLWGKRGSANICLCSL